jgi:two-component system, NtrC family, sensor kinase
MILPAVHIWFIDVAGSVLMIVFSFLCLLLAHELRSHDRNNVIWTYLLWVSYGLALFAISRSAGHILKQALFMAGKTAAWNSIKPFSGAINTLMFVVVASITLFFERIWVIYQQILKDKQALQSAHKELVYLNQNLEQMVLERTGALTHSEHKYRRIFEVSKDMILVSKDDGSIVDLNPAGYKLLGLNDRDDDRKEKRFQDFFANPAYWDKIREMIIKEGFISNFEIDLQNLQGAKIESLISGSYDSGTVETGSTIHFLVKDIEQRRSMEKQMAQAEKLASIGQLSAGVAHEINNPLGIILGYTQLLLKNRGSEEEKHEDLKTIEKNVKNCKAIVEDLLSFARGSESSKEITRIHDIIDDVLSFMQHDSNMDHIQISTSFDPQVPPMELDAKKIKQVFINLLMNAKHAIDRKGKIKIATRLNLDADQLLVKVTDNGHGIDKDNLSRIFDPFFTTKPTGEGTGLGLSVSYGIIKNHGGDIVVESEIGKGSIFTVTLPVPLRNKGNRFATQRPSIEAKT